jgi:hypothetical protein
MRLYGAVHDDYIVVIKVKLSFRWAVGWAGWDAGKFLSFELGADM